MDELYLFFSSDSNSVEASRAFGLISWGSLSFIEKKKKKDPLGMFQER